MLGSCVSLAAAEEVYAVKFTLQHTDQQTKARAGLLETDHGPIETPIFMPVGTVASVKGVHQRELRVGCTTLWAGTGLS